MSVIGWVVFGLIAGFIASKLVNKEGSGLIVDIILGVVGAVVGGYLMTVFSGEPFAAGFNILSMLVAIVGAVIVLMIYHAVFRSRTSL